MNDFGFSDEDWRSINAAVLQLANDPVTSRLDLKIGDIMVLIYKAGTVIRVDFKGML